MTTIATNDHECPRCRENGKVFFEQTKVIFELMARCAEYKKEQGSCDCQDFKKACEDGSDNENYGPLFCDGSYRGTKWIVGDGLNEPKFCPWCGKNLPPAPPKGE